MEVPPAKTKKDFSAMCKLIKVEDVKKETLGWEAYGFVCNPLVVFLSNAVLGWLETFPWGRALGFWGLYAVNFAKCDVFWLFFNSKLLILLPPCLLEATAQL